jgi:ketosteroid isomerase-like protein
MNLLSIGCRIGAALCALTISAAALAGPAEQAEEGFVRQRIAWNKGDIEAALDFYWKSPEIIWVNKAGVSQGFAGFAQAMRDEYAGRPEQMGVYSGEVLLAREVSPETGLIVVRWSIDRDGRRLMGGVSTQLWEQVDGAWRIVFEHAS